MNGLIQTSTSRRQVDIYVPADDFLGPRPLLVMHDGQNLFDDSTSTWGHSWKVREAIETLRPLGVVLPVVAGLYNTGLTRAAEYAPQRSIETLPDEPYQFVGEQLASPLLGDQYQAEIVSEVLPLVRSFVQISENRDDIGIAGSSMGGLASLYAVTCYPETFGAALSLSTHWSVSSDRWVENVIDQLPDPTSGIRLWLDHGTETLDAEYGEKQVVADRRLAARGWYWPQVESRRYLGTAHHESAWAQRLPEILRWWLLATSTSQERV